MPLREQERFVCCVGGGWGSESPHDSDDQTPSVLVMELQDRKQILPLHDVSTSSCLLSDCS